MNVRNIVMYVAAVLFAALLVQRFYYQRGPYFELPATLQDHLFGTTREGANAIELAERAEPIIPRGATVTLIRPTDTPPYDHTDFLTASGIMPRHHVVYPALDLPRPHLPKYVITIEKPLEHPEYRLHADIPGGKIYVLR